MALKIAISKAVLLKRLSDEVLQMPIEEISKQMTNTVFPHHKIKSTGTFADGSLTQADVEKELNRRDLQDQEQGVYENICKNLITTDNEFLEVRKMVAEHIGQPLEEVHYWNYARQLGTFVWVRTAKFKPKTFDLKEVDGVPIIYGNYIPTRNFPRIEPAFPI